MSVKLINQIHMQKSHGFSPMCITKVTFASITSWTLLQCFHLFLFWDPKSTLFRLAHRSHLTPHTGQPWRKATGHKAWTSETSIIDLKKTNWDCYSSPRTTQKKKHMKSKNETLGKRCVFFKSIVAPFHIRSSHRFQCWKKYCIPLPLNLLMIPQRKNSRNIYIKVPKIPGPYMDMLFSAYAAIKETQAFYWPYVDTNEGLLTWSLNIAPEKWWLEDYIYTWF